MSQDPGGPQIREVRRLTTQKRQRNLFSALMCEWAFSIPSEIYIKPLLPNEIYKKEAEGERERQIEDREKEGRRRRRP